jgi:acyl-CoA thioester hydrolase
MHDHRLESGPDPRDLPGAFRHRVEVVVRFGDTDGMRHVNNAKYLTYCEVARIAYWTDITGEPFAVGDLGSESLILAEARITYRAPAFHGEIVTVESRATRIGRSSFSLEHRLVARMPGGMPRLIAVAESVLVRYDYGAGRSVPIPDEYVEAIERFEDHRLRAAI